jgi:hemoglobin
MRNVLVFGVLLGVVAAAGAQPAGTAKATVKPPVAAAPVPADTPVASSLYKRLGGYDAIAAVADDFIPKLVSDPQLSRLFVGFSKHSQDRIRQLFVDQLCMATGGPCIYLGRDTKTTHAGIGITESDWQVSVKLLVATLDKLKVPKKEQDELLALATSLKKDIVEKP